MNKYIGIAVMHAPPAWTLYPLLTMFLVFCVINGAWQEALEKRVFSSDEIQIKTIIKYVEPENQVDALSEIQV
jgi:hypothetical protein